MASLADEDTDEEEVVKDAKEEGAEAAPPVGAELGAEVADDVVVKLPEPCEEKEAPFRWGDFDGFL